MSKTQSISRDNLKAIYDVACDGWKNKIEGYAKRNPFDNDITFTQSEVDEMLKASNSDQIKVLKKFFALPMDIRDKVKSFIDACNHLGIKPESVYSKDDTKDEIAFKKLKVIIKALNEGWYPDWTNESEYKYFNYFKMKGGFSYWSTLYYITAITNVPSALCLKSHEVAEHCVKIALEEYKEYYS